MPVHPHRTPCRVSSLLEKCAALESLTRRDGSRPARDPPDPGAAGSGQSGPAGILCNQPRSRLFDQPVARVWDATGQKSFGPARHSLTESSCVVAGHPSETVPFFWRHLWGAMAGDEGMLADRKHQAIPEASKETWLGRLRGGTYGVLGL